MKEIKQKIKRDCDISVTNLLIGISDFYDRFNKKPQNLNVSINTIFYVMEISTNREVFGLSYLGFSCSKEFDDDYWELSAFSDNLENKFILYSPGA